MFENNTWNEFKNNLVSFSVQEGLVGMGTPVHKGNKRKTWTPDKSETRGFSHLSQQTEI